jgi:importin subunit alpha-1
MLPNVDQLAFCLNYSHWIGFTKKIVYKIVRISCTSHTQETSKRTTNRYISLAQDQLGGEMSDMQSKLDELNNLFHQEHRIHQQREKKGVELDESEYNILSSVCSNDHSSSLFSSFHPQKLLEIHGQELPSQQQQQQQQPYLSLYPTTRQDISIDGYFIVHPPLNGSFDFLEDDKKMHHVVRQTKEKREYSPVNHIKNSNSIIKQSQEVNEITPSEDENSDNSEEEDQSDEEKDSDVAMHLTKKQQQEKQTSSHTVFNMHQNVDPLLKNESKFIAESSSNLQCPKKVSPSQKKRQQQENGKTQNKQFPTQQKKGQREKQKVNKKQSNKNRGVVKKEVNEKKQKKEQQKSKKLENDANMLALDGKAHTNNQIEKVNHIVNKHKLNNNNNNNSNNNNNNNTKENNGHELNSVLLNGDKVDEDNNFEEQKNVNNVRITVTKSNNPLSANAIRTSEVASNVLPPSVSKDLERELHHFMSQLNSTNNKTQLKALVAFRKLLSQDKNQNEIIDHVIRVGVVPLFIKFLHKHDLPTHQFEASWALTNIASGTSAHTEEVVKYGAIPIFTELLKTTKSDDVLEQSIHALGNIAGDNTKHRDLVLRNGVLSHLLNTIAFNSRRGVLEKAIWTLSNLCGGKPSPDFSLIKPALPTLALFLYVGDEEILAHVCWAISYLCDGPDDRIEAVVNAHPGLVKRLTDLLMHHKLSVQTPALRAIGNIVTGNEDQTQAVVDAGALVSLGNLLKHKNKSIRREACFTISNITAGTETQINAVIETKLIPKLNNILKNSKDSDVKKEAAWAMSNVTSGGNAEQIQYLVDKGCIKSFCALLKKKDTGVVNVALEGLCNILNAGQSGSEYRSTRNNRDHSNNGAETVNERETNKNGAPLNSGEYQASMPQSDLASTPSKVHNPYIEHLIEARGVSIIRKLQAHKNKIISDKAREIITNFFSANESLNL